MGGICSRARRSRSIDNANVNTEPSGSYHHVNGDSGNNETPSKAEENSSAGNSMDMRLLRDPYSSQELVQVAPYGIGSDDSSDGIPRLSRVLSNKSRSAKLAKVSEVSSLLGRAGTAGLGKAVEVLDTLGSSMTGLTLGSGFTSGVTTKGNKISILAFEVANTVVKGSNLMESLSKDNIRRLKEEVLISEGVQNLVSRDMDELLRIAASDKRDELRVFSGEVVRFGNRCKDPQWHNLDRYFEKLKLENTPQMQLKEDAETLMQQLMSLVQHTAELYHELHALDRFEQDYRRKHQEEDNPNATQRGDSLAILKAELKSQRKHVRNLKKKSLWSKILEEIMEKLVDIVHFLHVEIYEAFGVADSDKAVKGSQNKLGSAGLALHYANIITQIDTLVSRSSSVPPNTRDALYQGLPPSIKTALRSRLQAFQTKEELTIPQVKVEMEKTLRWLVPIANNTTKAHHGFGWVGEWANTGSESSRKAGGEVLRIETLHHADKDEAESRILELVVWLHGLIGGGTRSPIRVCTRSPLQLSTHGPRLTPEDREMLSEVSKRRRATPGISKSQELRTTAKKHHRLSKSSSHSPSRLLDDNPFPIPVIDFDLDPHKALDLIDNLVVTTAQTLM